MNTILNYLKLNGEKFDAEIAAAAGITLDAARKQLSALSSQGEVMSCYSMKIIDGKKIEGMTYRLSGHAPKASPGRKSKS
jgi:predicted ArsR family transcriptional regulator